MKKFVASQDDEIEGLFGKKMSLVHVYFKDLEVTKFSKQENFGIKRQLKSANVGARV